MRTENCLRTAKNQEKKRQRKIRVACLHLSSKSHARLIKPEARKVKTQNQNQNSIVLLTEHEMQIELNFMCDSISLDLFCSLNLKLSFSCLKLNEN